MRSPYCFMCRPVGGVRYDSVNKSGLVLSASLEDHTTTNRQAEIISLPLNYSGEIQVGDILLVHHNTFRKYFDMKGREKSSPSFFKDDLFLIFPDQYFMYSRDGVWYAPSPYCFMSLCDEPLTAIVEYPNIDMINSGILKGDKVIYQPDSDYEFRIDDKKLYRMFNRNICIQLT